MKERNKQSLIRVITLFIVCTSIYLLQEYILDKPILNFIIDNNKIFALITWVIFTIYSSVFEGYYFTHKAASNLKDDKDLHPLFMAIRTCLLVPLLFISDYKTAITCVFIFPFLHDGVYYTTRNKLVHGIYKKRFFDQSSTSTAFSTRFFTPIVRTVFAIVGLVYFIITY